MEGGLRKRHTEAIVQLSRREREQFVGQQRPRLLLFLASGAISVGNGGRTAIALLLLLLLGRGGFCSGCGSSPPLRPRGVPRDEVGRAVDAVPHCLRDVILHDKR